MRRTRWPTAMAGAGACGPAAAVDWVIPPARGRSQIPPGCGGTLGPVRIGPPGQATGRALPPSAERPGGGRGPLRVDPVVLRARSRGGSDRCGPIPVTA